MKTEYKTPTRIRQPEKVENICQTSEKKVCIGCNTEKLEVEFNSKQSRCKKCQAKYKKQYYKNNKAYINKKSQAWRAANPERNKQLKKNWEIANKKEIRTRRRVYEKSLRQNNPAYRAICNIRRRLNEVLKGRKHKKTLELLGCTQEFLKNYIRAKFTVGMTWENYGKWHLDHIIPLSKVDLKDQKQLEKVCHYTNLQPLWAQDNLKKSDKL